MCNLVAGKHPRRGLVTLGWGLLAAALTLPAAAHSAHGSPAPQPQVLTAEQIRYNSLLACPTTLDQIGRVVIPVKIDGHGPFRFVIDTGANHSSVSPRLVRRLGLKMTKGSAVDLEGITGSSAIRAVNIKTLQAGSLLVRDALMPVLRTPMMAGADGILGVAGLPNMALFVNFQNNRVQITHYLTPGVRFDYSRVHTEVVAGGLMAIPAYVNNVRTVAIIDTGSERTLGNMALRAALHMQHAPGTPEPITAVYGATKQVEIGRLATSPPIALGPMRIVGAEIIFGNFHIFKVWSLERRPAIIVGMDVLGTVGALGFDFRQHDLFFARMSQFNSARLNARSYQTSIVSH